MLRAILVASLALMLLLSLPAQAAADSKKPNKLQALRSGISWHRQQTWHWQGVAFVRQTPSSYAEKGTRSIRYLRWTAKIWHQRRVAAKRHAENPPNLSAWLCIHRGEGAWNSNTGNGYYGGMQMDWGFMSTYGGHLLHRKGTADNWTPLEQIWVAERARASGRGFYPWPTTARNCNLI